MVVIAIFMHVLIINYLQCYGYDIKVLGCNQKRMSTNEGMGKKLKNTLIQVINKSSNCLPTGFVTKINNTARSQTITIQLDCLTEDCGWGDNLTTTIGISAVAYVLGERNCGCLEATMLHEMLHASGSLGNTSEDERKAEGCELNCYEDCAVVKKGVTKEDCCEDKGKK